MHLINSDPQSTYKCPKYHWRYKESVFLGPSPCPQPEVLQPSLAPTFGGQLWSQQTPWNPTGNETHSVSFFPLQNQSPPKDPKDTTFTPSHGSISSMNSSTKSSIPKRGKLVTRHIVSMKKTWSKTIYHISGSDSFISLLARKWSFHTSSRFVLYISTIILPMIPNVLPFWSFQNLFPQHPPVHWPGRKSANDPWSPRGRGSVKTGVSIKKTWKTAVENKKKQQCITNHLLYSSWFYHIKDSTGLQPSGQGDFLTRSGPNLVHAATNSWRQTLAIQQFLLFSITFFLYHRNKHPNFPRPQ